MRKRLILFLSILAVITLVFFEQTEATRIFEKNSTWYTQIPANPKLDPKSSRWVNYFKTWGGTRDSCGFSVNYNHWTSPLYYADENTTVKTVTYDSRTFKVPIETGWHSTDEAETCKCNYRDNHMIIVDTYGRDPITGNRDGKPKIWTLYRASNCTTVCPTPGGFSNDNTWDAEAGWRLKSSNGIVKCGSSDGTWGGLRGQVVSWASPAHGFMTYEELAGKGEIDHAIAVAGPQSKRNTGYPDNWVYPSPDCCGNFGFATSYNADTPNVPPLGIRFQLNVDASFCDAISNTIQKKICHAFRKYGFIFIDHTDPTGCSTTMGAENLSYPQYGYSWSGLPIASAAPPASWWDHIRVVLPVCTGDECTAAGAICSGESQNFNCISSTSDSTPPAAPAIIEVK